MEPKHIKYPLVYLRVYIMPINIYILTEKVSTDIYKHVSDNYVWNPHHDHSLNNSTASRGFSETEIAVGAMWCTEAVQGFHSTWLEMKIHHINVLQTLVWCEIMPLNYKFSQPSIFASLFSSLILNTRENIWTHLA